MKAGNAYCGLKGMLKGSPAPTTCHNKGQS